MIPMNKRKAIKMTIAHIAVLRHPPFFSLESDVVELEEVLDEEELPEEGLFSEE